MNFAFILHEGCAWGNSLVADLLLPSENRVFCSHVELLASLRNLLAIRLPSSATNSATEISKITDLHAVYF
ncbi:unnamed protein product [Dicrocoelium dendriticum]|nr:unnamed protein product [Dicrocoelium dendriticum]